MAPLATVVMCGSEGVKVEELGAPVDTVFHTAEQAPHGAYERFEEP